MHEIYCTYDDDLWIIWFPNPLGGKNILESFEHEHEARAYLQDQIENAYEGEDDDL